MIDKVRLTESETIGFTNLFNRMRGEWWLCGVTLSHWLKRRELAIYRGQGAIAVTESEEYVKEYFNSRNIAVENSSSPIVVNLYGNRVPVSCGAVLTSDIVASESERKHHKLRCDLTSAGLWQRNIESNKPYCVRLPYRYGTYLDKTHPGWWTGGGSMNIETKGCWFTGERRNNGYELLGLMFDCAESAGIRDSMFVGFGNLLGYVMFGDLIPYDTDMDMCINSETTTYEKDKKYLKKIKEPIKIGPVNYPHGLVEKMYRKSSNRSDTDRPLWISIGHKSINHEHGVKSCNWWFFEHSGHMFHSKGDRWVNTGKVNTGISRGTDEATALGMPKWMVEELVEVDFNGVKVNMPKHAGSCLDYWYPGWCPYGKGASAKKLILCIGNWKNKATWRMAKEY